MENILDFEYILRPVELDSSEAAQEDREAARRDFGSERDGLFQQEEDIRNFRLYGPPFEGAPSPDPPEWSKFITDSQNHLAKNGKDLWICVWLTEVMLAYRGFQGLAEGLELIRSLCEDQWDQILPRPDGEDGIEYTVKLLSAVGKRDAFVDAIRFAPITMESGEHLPASCATIDELDGGERSALIGSTSDEFISDVYANAKKANDEWNKLDEVLEICGDAKPPFAKIRQAIEDCINDISSVYPQVIIDEDDSETGLTVTEGATEAAPSSGGQLSGDNHLKNREQAFKTLEALSRYFRENEPNSPVATLLKQAVRWGRMSFEELMQTVVDDDDARQQILRLTGAKNEDDSEDDD